MQSPPKLSPRNSALIKFSQTLCTIKAFSLCRASFHGDIIPAGLAGVADTIRESAKAVSYPFHRQTMKIIMMTDDNAITAEKVAKKFGIN